MQPYVDYVTAHTEEVHEFLLTELDRTGVPVVNVSGFGPHGAHGVGYGETEAEAARSAYGEAVENLAAGRYAARVAPIELDVEQALARGAVDPASLSLVAGTTVPERLLWVAARDLDGRERLVPLEAAVTCATEWEVAAGTREPLFPPITNGQGAGYAGDEDRAVRHGLMELLQRDLNWSQFKALDTGRWVDWSDVVDLPLDARLKYSGQAFGVHAFHAAAVEPADSPLSSISRTSTGEGADTDPRVAARKALLELCSSRCRKQFFFGGEDGLDVAPAAYRARFEDRDAATPLQENGVDLHERFDALLGDTEALERVVDRITREQERIELPPGYPSETPFTALRDRVVVIDMTEPGDAAYACKVVVPGLEAEVLSHHRIGPRAVGRLLHRLPEVVHHGERPGPSWRRAAGAWVDTKQLEQLAATFFPLYREPFRHDYTAPSGLVRA